MATFGRSQTFAKPSTSVAGPLAAPRRISIEAVRRAFRTGRRGYGLLPIRGRWTDGCIGCDALAALVAERTGKEPRKPDSLVGVARILELSLDYVRGFMIGWDARPAVRLSRQSVKAGTATYLGWRDGRDAADAMGIGMIRGEDDGRGECRGR